MATKTTETEDTGTEENAQEDLSPPAALREAITAVDTAREYLFSGGLTDEDLAEAAKDYAQALDTRSKAAKAAA